PGSATVVRPGAFRAPRQSLALARRAAACSASARWSALYTVLWRLVHERHDLLALSDDRDVRRLFALAARARRETERAEQQEVLRLEAEGGGARPFVLAGGGLDALKQAATPCGGCDLFPHPTQMGVGRRPAAARRRLAGAP